MGTGGTPYINPLRPRVTIKTIEDNDTLYEYDAFDADSSDITITDLFADDAVGESGTFSMTINDHNNEIPKDNIHNVKVFIELGKTTTSFQHFLIGYGDLFGINRPHTAAQFYTLNGLGSKDWAYRLFISRREKYRRDESDAKMHNIVENAFTKRLWRPLKKQDESIQDITGWSSDGISSTINTPLTVIDETFTYFGDFMDRICDITGAVWFVDYSTGEEIFTYKTRPQMATNIIIKSGDLQDRVNDVSTKVSYIKSAFSVSDDTSNQGGFANRLFSVTIQDSQEMWPLDTVNYAKSNTNLTFKALGQQIILDNDARRIQSLELHLRKIGDPSSPQDRVNGGVFLDKNNKPNMTYTLDEFHIGLGSIEQQGTKVNVPVDISEKKLDVAQSKIWVCLFQRSNERDENGDPDGNGNPNHGTEDTIVWAHNNSFNTTQTVNGEQVRSGQAPEGDFNSKSKLSWQISATGPTYYVKVFSDIRRVFARTNGRSKRTQRLREAFIPSDFINDPGDVTRYLSLNLSDISKGRRGIADFRVTVPNNFLYRPYQKVSFHDGLSEIDETLDVMRASYSCISGVGDDVPLGTLHAVITLGGSYNTLIGACSCL